MDIDNLKKQALAEYKNKPIEEIEKRGNAFYCPDFYGAKKIKYYVYTDEEYEELPFKKSRKIDLLSSTEIDDIYFYVCIDSDKLMSISLD